MPDHDLYGQPIIRGRSCVVVIAEGLHLNFARAPEGDTNKKRSGYMILNSFHYAIGVIPAHRFSGGAFILPVYLMRDLQVRGTISNLD